MHRLIYKSILSEKTNWTELVEIARHARKKNAELQLSGMLIFFENHVLQVLEGDITTLNNLYQSILNDDRHHSVHMLDFRSVQTALFQQWKMKEVNLDRLCDKTKEKNENSSICNTLERYLYQPNEGQPFSDDAECALALFSIVGAYTSEK